MAEVRGSRYARRVAGPPTDARDPGGPGLGPSSVRANAERTRAKSAISSEPIAPAPVGLTPISVPTARSPGARHPGAKRPGLARAGQAVRGTATDGFSELLRLALDDAGVAQSLVLAWATLDRAGRRALVDAIVLDARRASLDVGRLLAVLRSLERDPWVFDGITCEALRGQDGDIQRWVLVQQEQALGSPSQPDASSHRSAVPLTVAKRIHPGFR